MTGYEIVFVVVLLGFAAFVMVDVFKVHRPDALNVIGLMFVTHCLAQLVPALTRVAGDGGPAAQRYFYACVFTAALIPIGGLIGDALYPTRRGTPISYMGTPTRDSPRVIATVRSLVLFATLLAAALLVVRARLADGYPLQAMVLGTADFQELKVLRQKASTLGYVFSMSQMTLMPALFAIVVANWRRLSEGIYRPTRWAALAVVFVYNSYASKKTPIAILFVVGFFIWLYRDAQARREGVRRKSFLRRYWPLLVCVVGAFGYPLFVFLNKAVGQTQTLQYIVVEAILGRIFVRPADNAYFAFELFPTSHEFTWFADIDKFAAVLGLKPVDLSLVIALYKLGTVFANAPPPSIGSFYAEGGWVVLILGVLVAAAIFKTTENVFHNLKEKTTVDIAFYGLFIYGGFRFSWGQFHSILLTECVLPTLVLLLAWHWAIRSKTPAAARPRPVAIAQPAE